MISPCNVQPNHNPRLDSSFRIRRCSFQFSTATTTISAKVTSAIRRSASRINFASMGAEYHSFVWCQENRGSCRSHGAAHRVRPDSPTSGVRVLPSIAPVTRHPYPPTIPSVPTPSDPYDSRPWWHRPSAGHPNPLATPFPCAGNPDIPGCRRSIDRLRWRRRWCGLRCDHTALFGWRRRFSLRRRRWPPYWRRRLGNRFRPLLVTTTQHEAAESGESQSHHAQSFRHHYRLHCLVLSKNITVPPFTVVHR